LEWVALAVEEGRALVTVGFVFDLVLVFFFFLEDVALGAAEVCSETLAEDACSSTVAVG
jgi:hypothetical protein